MADGTTPHSVVWSYVHVVWPPTHSSVLAMLEIKWLCLHLANTGCTWFSQGVCVYMCV